MLRRTREWRPRATLVVGVGVDDVPDSGAELDPNGALQASPTFRAMIEECRAVTGAVPARQATYTAGAD
jgi:hypothetical protein